MTQPALSVFYTGFIYHSHYAKICEFTHGGTEHQHILVSLLYWQQERTFYSLFGTQIKLRMFYVVRCRMNDKFYRQFT